MRIASLVLSKNKTNEIIDGGLVVTECWLVDDIVGAKKRK